MENLVMGSCFGYFLHKTDVETTELVTLSEGCQDWGAVLNADIPLDEVTFN